MTTAAELRALVLTTDPWLATTFADVAREIGIETQRPASLHSVPVELSKTKYEGVLLDFDTVPVAPAVLSCIRENPSNKNAVVFAVATGAARKQELLDAGIKLAFARPLERNDVRRALYAAYEAMARERRRYFRCAVEIPVEVRRKDSGQLTGKTMNLSSNGMALSSSCSFHLAERLEIAMLLKEVGATVIGEGTVVWDDKHGKTGISFNCADVKGQRELDTWLDSHYLRLLQLSRASITAKRLAE